MDGLSTVASGMAVASLAIQLVDSVREFQRFMRRLSHVRTELKRLIDLLYQLELIFECIGNLIPQQEGYMTDANITSNIFRSMKTCEDTLSILGNVVESAKKASVSKSKVGQSFGLYKLAWKRKDIEDYENELQRMIGILDLAMTINLTAMQNRSTNRILTQLQEMHTQEICISRSNPRRSIPEITDQMHIRPTLSHQSSLKATTSTTTYTYRNIFGRVSTRKISQSVDSINGKPPPQKGCNIKDKTTWTFVPSFLSLCLEIQYINICGSIQRSYRTYPQIRDHHPIWDMIWHSPVSDIQALFTSRTVSPFSVDSAGSTLLHYAAVSRNFELSKMLFDLGLKGDEVDKYGCQPSQCLIMDYNSLEDTKNILHLFKSNAYQFSNRDTAEHCVFSELFSREYADFRLEIFNYCVDECVSAQNINDFNISLVFNAFEEMECCSDIDLRRGWKSAIKTLVVMGAHLFGGCPSLLDDIVLLAQNPFDSVELGTEWLDILRDAGVDIVQYLRMEFEMHKHNPDIRPAYTRPHDTLCKKRQVITSNGTTRVSWDWFIDPKARAYELLNEFKCVDWFNDSFNGCRKPLFEIKYPKWLEYEEAVEAQRLAEARFARRQRKKAWKLARAQGFRKGPKVPGAWID